MSSRDNPPFHLPGCRKKHNGYRLICKKWHPSSTLVHEAALAVLAVQPSHFWPFSKALFDASDSYTDENVVNETRNATYGRLAKLAGGVGVDEKKVLERLWISDKPDAEGRLNMGNAVTNDLKVVVKMGRLVGVHVSPTVVFNGVVENGISSGFSGEQWEEWLQKNVV